MVLAHFSHEGREIIAVNVASGRPWVVDAHDGGGRLAACRRFREHRSAERPEGRGARPGNGSAPFFARHSRQAHAPAEPASPDSIDFQNYERSRKRLLREEGAAGEHIATVLERAATNLSNEDLGLVRDYNHHGREIEAATEPKNEAAATQEAIRQQAAAADTALVRPVDPQWAMGSAHGNKPLDEFDYGWRQHPVTGKRSFHTGIDIGMNAGEEIRAMASGVVEFSGVKGGYGNHVKIDHGRDSRPEGRGCRRRYAWPRPCFRSCWIYRRAFGLQRRVS